jgi:hypothetical protein
MWKILICSDTEYIHRGEENPNALQNCLKSEFCELVLIMAHPLPALLRHEKSFKFFSKNHQILLYLVISKITQQPYSA